MHFPVSASTRVSVSVMISSAHLPSVLWNIHRTGIYSLSMYLSLSLRGIFLTGHVRSDRIQRYFSLLSSESCQALSHAAPNSRSCKRASVWCGMVLLTAYPPNWSCWNCFGSAGPVERLGRSIAAEIASQGNESAVHGTRQVCEKGTAAAERKADGHFGHACSGRI